ncbi:unnamed protein product [Pleuronectes platessa]|uniref:Uncharacterized protein n=1 Tax=Pleuronectes platessa TaxID=8262 RepID=A0A9N7UG62_PLEPL|nr:unnamed protein product [Pleuronectes platessa]
MTQLTLMTKRKDHGIGYGCQGKRQELEMTCRTKESSVRPKATRSRLELAWRNLFSMSLHLKGEVSLRKQKDKMTECPALRNISLTMSRNSLRLMTQTWRSKRLSLH